MADFVNIECGCCKMIWGMPRYFYDAQMKLCEKGSFFCPTGHERHFIRGETEETKLRRQLNQKIQNEAYLESRIEEEKQAKEDLERKNAAQRGVVIRMKNRSAHGVCLCCNRSFSDLARHMQTKHPDFKKGVA